MPSFKAGTVSLLKIQRDFMSLSPEKFLDVREALGFRSIPAVIAAIFWNAVNKKTINPQKLGN